MNGERAGAPMWVRVTAQEMTVARPGGNSVVAGGPCDRGLAVIP